VSVKAVFEKVRKALEETGIPYFVSGSFASSAHGIPRSTNDIDIVIAPTHEQLKQLLALFPDSDYATYGEDAFDALARESLFNVIDYATMWRVDFIIGKSTPFDASRFSRRAIVNIAGVPLFTASPEDILLTKLWWGKMGESERQITDAAGIISVQREHLDRDYVQHWVMALQLEQQWASALEKAN
jgi:hypothetical protein